MSHLAFARVAPDGAGSVPQPGVQPEAERLRLLIERQPTCLLRIAVDGVILAANDAALGQLAATELGEALGHRFAKWLPPDQQDRWSDFAGRVRANRAASVECDLKDLAGNQHAVRLQGVSHPGHPDGVDSMIVTIRDISGVRRLEKALQDHESTRRTLAETRARLEALMQERADREAAIEQRQASLARESNRIETLLADAIRSAIQASRLVQLAAGQNAGSNAGPAAGARAERATSPAAERAG